MNKLLYFAAACVLATAASCSQNSGSGTEAAASDSEITEQQATEPDAEPAAAETVTELGEGDNLVPGELPIVADFWATWCGPCMQFKPVFHDAAKKYATKATFVAADIDVCNALKDKFDVSSIPTVIILMPDGTIKKNVGYMDAAQFDAFLGDIAK